MPRQDKTPPTTFYDVRAALPLTIFFGLVPGKFSSAMASVHTAMAQIFQRQDRGSTWLAFALVWVACATIALASAYLVFRVSETRRRIFGR